MALATDLTYLQVRQRIAGNLNRDDLDTNPLSDSSVVHQFFKDRVLHYSKEFFYNAQFVDTSKSTVAGEAFVNLPDGWQQVNFVRFNHGGLWIPLGHNGRPIDYHSILHMDANATQGIPSVYALYQNPTGGKMAIRIFPVPSGVFNLEFTMDKPPDAPTADADSNFWTQDAQTLMIESVCEQICRNKINRPLKADQHLRNVEDLEASLNSKSIRIMGGIQVRAHY